MTETTYVRLHDVITGTELLARWPGVPEEELTTFVEKGWLPAYTPVKKGTVKNGDEFFLCSRGASTIDGIPSNYLTIYEWGLAVFKMEDVLRAETYEPSFRSPLHDVGSLSERTKYPRVDSSAKTECDDASGLIMSPGQTNPLDGENSARGSGLAKAQEAQCARTGAATHAALSKRLGDWKRETEIMVRVAYACGQENSKLLKRSQLQARARKHGGELSQTALDLLRDSLPDDCVSRTAGAPSSGESSDSVGIK